MLHEADIPDFDYNILLQLGTPVDSSVSKAYQDAIRSAKHPVHSVTLTPSPGALTPSPGTLTPPPRYQGPVVLPVWIFDYWREIQLAASYQEQWKAALVWLQSHSKSPTAAEHCQQLLMALSFFPWSGNNASVQDITSLLSRSPPKSYLSSFHIDHAIKSISKQHQDLHGPKVSGRHIFVTVDTLGSIPEFYGSRRPPAKTGNSHWEHLMEIENQVIKGEVDSISGVHYLPLHWVSVVLDIQQGRILYGDSLGQPMPKSSQTGFTKWIKHLYQRSSRSAGGDLIQVCSLPTGYQNDGASCGLFALNAISHHYLGHPLLSPNPTLLACRRIEIAQDLIQENTVCPILYNILHSDLMQTIDC